MLSHWNAIFQDLAEIVELITMGFWTSLVNFVSDIALHDELNEVIGLKTIEYAINRFSIIQHQVFRQIFTTQFTNVIFYSNPWFFTIRAI